MIPTSSKGHVVLVGSMGVGKTTTAGIVGNRLGRPVEDDDIDRPARLATARAESPPRRGEAPPQSQEEAEHLLRSLEAGTPSVIGAADGVVDGQRIRDALRSAQVVWLRARPATVADRLQTDHGDELGADVFQALTALADRRVDHYRRVANLVIETDNLNPDQVADRIIAWLTSQDEETAQPTSNVDLDTPRDRRADELPGNDDLPVDLAAEADPDLGSLRGTDYP